MTHPEIVKLESLVSQLSEALSAREENASVEAVNAAREYAEACGSTNDRLQLCLDILGKGRDKEHQALLTATRQPDLLDTCAVLSELQTDEYAEFCRRHHLSIAPPLNERAKQAIDPLYQKAGTFQKKLRMEFSAANSKRDFLAALEIARQLIHVDSSDAGMKKQAQALENRLLKDVITKKIGPALEKGDDDSVIEALKAIRSVAPGRKPKKDESDEAPWIEALELETSIQKEDALHESANLLIRAEEAKEASNLNQVVEFLAKIQSSIETHSLKLSSEKSKLYQQLVDWKDDALERSRLEELFQEAISDLKVLIKKITDKEFQTTAPPFSETQADALELQKLWKDIAEFRKPVSDELQEKARKVLEELNGKIQRHKSAKRRNLIGVIAGSSALLITAIIVAVLFSKASQASTRMLEAKEDGRAEDLEALLTTTKEASPPWLSLGSLPRTIENSEAWLEEQKSLAAQQGSLIIALSDELNSQSTEEILTPVSLSSFKGRIEEIDGALESINQDFRVPLDEQLISLRFTLDERITDSRNQIVESFGKELVSLDQSMRQSLDYEAPVDSLMESIAEVAERISLMDSMAASETEELRPSIADLTRFDILKEKFQKFDDSLTEVKDIFTDCKGASDLETYLENINRLKESDFLTGDQKIRLGKLLVVADSNDRIFREILVRGDLLGWNHLTEQEYSSEGYPSDITNPERVEFLTFRDDDSLSEMYTYTVTKGGKTRTIYSRGETLELGGIGSNQAARGNEIYDPSRGSLVQIEFTKKLYALRSAGPENPDYEHFYGAIPENESLSSESKFFNSLDIGKYPTSDFTGFRRPLLTAAEEVIASDSDIDPLFRAFLLIRIGKIMLIRPEKWLLNFTSFTEDYDELMEIVGASLTSSSWCSPESQDSTEEKLRAFFEARRDISYIDQAKTLREFYARMYTGGLSFCGFLDQKQEIHFHDSKQTSPDIFGFNADHKIVVLYRKRADGTWDLQDDPAEFTPLLHLNLDPQLTLEASAEKHSASPDDHFIRAELPWFMQPAPQEE